jgi:signal transduction protein with GAF and PtsI domain
VTSREISLQYFKTFFDACQAVLSSESLTDILDILVRRTVGALRVKAGALMLIDETTGRLELVSSHLLSRKYRRKGPLRADTSIPEVLDGSPVSIQDAFEDPRIQYQEELREEGINTLLSVPVVVKEKVIGVLRLYAAARRDFSGREMEFVSALAEIGGLAIANARIYEQEDIKLASLLKNVGVELPKQPKEREKIFQPSAVAPVEPSRSLDFFRALHEVTRTILSTLDSGEVMDLIIEKVIAIMRIKACAIRLINQTTRELELLASRGLSVRFLEKGPLHADRSIHETLQGAPVLIRDAATDPRIEYPEKMAEEGVVSLLSLPIVAGDRIIGILRLYTGETRTFDRDELAFLTAISVIAGIAIMNAKLYEKTKYDLSFWGATLDYFQEKGKQEG